MTTDSIPARWRSTRAEAAAIRECAVAFGVSDRAVRSWRRANDPRWVKFLSARAGSSLGQLEASAFRTDLETSDPPSEERAALRRFKLLEAEITRAMDRGELGSVPVITRAASDAHKLLCSCREAAEAWRIRRREMVSAAEIRELRERYLEPIYAALKYLPAEAAEQCNPGNPLQAREALVQWLQGRFEPHFNEARRAFDEATTPPGAME